MAMLHNALLGAIAIGLFGGMIAYGTLFTPVKGDEGPTCAGQHTTGHKRVTVAEIARNEEAPGALVKAYGKLDRSAASDVFYLRDGAYAVRLDVAGCEDLEAFERGEFPAFVKGRVVTRDGVSFVRVDGMAQDAPWLVRYAFDASAFFGLAFLFALVLAFFRGVGWFLRLIGFSKRKAPKAVTEEQLQRRAGSSVLTGLFAPVVWAINPFVGAYSSVEGIVSGVKGLRSKKRAAAIAGIVLCCLTAIVSPLAFLAAGVYQDSEGFFLRPLIERFPEPRMKQPPRLIEKEPYVDAKEGFSVRLPLDWETGDGSGFGLTFLAYAPEEDKTPEGKTFTPNLTLLSGPSEGFDAKKSAEAIIAGRMKTIGDFRLHEDEALPAENGHERWLVGGSGVSDGNDLRTLGIIEIANGRGYFLEATTLFSAWQEHQEAIRQSLDSFTAR
ncbi:MAG TPA: hypothetical protein VL426_02930 [Candidatus Binatia bacterium]|nr:hypothetical protein [Candidatus Binatia bacterium]